MRPAARSETTDRLETAIRWLIATALATPLIVTPSTLFPYQVGKGSAIRILVELAAFLYVWRAVLTTRRRSDGGGLFWSVMAYAAVLVVATFAGVDPYGSWWGTVERMEGAFGTLHGVAVFVIARGVFASLESWRTIFRVSLVVSIFVVWYALAQMYPWARFLPVNDLAESQPGSTLGYASFAATYALFHIFMAGCLLVLERTPALRMAALAGLLLNLLLLTLTATRGALVALLAAIVVGAVAFMLDATRTQRHRLMVAGALVVSIGGFAGVRMLEGSEVLKNMPRAIQRMSTISPATSTGQTRLIALGVSWEAVKERPLLGWGPDQFDEAYRRHFDPAILSIEDAWLDRAHNKLAEVAVQSGVIGLLAYLSIFGFGLARLVRLMKKGAAGPESLLAWIALMLGCAYFVQNLFLFDTTVSTLLFFLMLAFVSFLTDRSAAVSETTDPRTSLPRRPLTMIGARKWIMVAAGAVVAWMIWSNVSAYRAAGEGLESVRAADPTRSLRHVRSAVALGAFPTPEVVRTLLSTLITSGRVTRPEWQPVVTEVVTEAERLNREGRADHRVLEYLGKVYNRMGARASADAERVLRQVISMAPRTHEARYELGLALLRRGEVEAGLEQFRAIVALNDRYAKGHWLLGVALVTQRRFEEGLRALERAVELGHPSDTPEGRAVLKAAREGAATEAQRNMQQK